MFLLTTILAFTVSVPFAVGIYFYRRVNKSSALAPIILLCGVWTVAEIYSFILRTNGIVNAHVSYVLTPIEVYLFCILFYRLIGNRHKYSIQLQGIVVIMFTLVVLEASVLSTPLNTITLTLQYVIVTVLLLTLFFRKTGHTLLILTLLFYHLSSFPYFFAWEWLRISNMSLLMFFSNIHSFVHAICYFIIAFTLWKSLSQSPARSLSRP